VSAEELDTAPIAFESHRRAIRAFFETAYSALPTASSAGL